MSNNTYVQNFIESRPEFTMDPDSKDNFIKYLEDENINPQCLDDVKDAFDAFTSNDDGGGGMGKDN